MTQVSKHCKTPKQAARAASPLEEHLDPELFRALGDPTRVLLLRCLAQCGRSCSVSEIAECCKVDFSVVSRHLSLLAAVGVLRSEKEGRTVFYIVDYEALARSFRALADALDGYRPGACNASGGCKC